MTRFASVALVMLMLGVSVQAIKPAPSVIILNQEDVSLGDVVTFTTSFPDSLNSDFVYVQVLCYQGDRALTFADSGRPDYGFLLGGTSSPWLASELPASCVAELFYWSKNGRYTVLASTDFEADGF